MNRINLRKVYIVYILVFIISASGLLPIGSLSARAAETPESATVPRDNKDSIGKFSDIFAYIPFGEGRTVNISIINISGRDYLFLPASSSLKSLIFHYTQDKSLIFLSDGKELPSDKQVDITNYLGAQKEDGSRVITLSVAQGETRSDHEIYVMQSANIPSVFINSSDPAKGRTYVDGSKSNKAEGSMTMITAKSSIVYDGALSQIKARGNTTFEADKKPYQIKLQTAADLSMAGGAGASKTWILLANAYDPTLIHNTIGLDMARGFGLNSPDFVSVDLYYDGAYRGNYLLCEKVQIGPGRVDIYDLESKNESANTGKDPAKSATATGANKYGDIFQYVTGMSSPESYEGGYLLELDNAYYKGERCYFLTSGGIPFVVKSPENCSKEEMLFISEYVEETLRAASAGGTNPDTGKPVSDYVDIETLARYFVFEEIVKNADSFASSTYFYLDKDSKLMAGPVWDLDDTYGIRDDMSASEGFCSGAFIQPFMNLPQFRAAVKSFYNSKGYSKAANPGIDAAVKNISRSQQMNRVLWNSSKQMYTKLDTYDADISHMKKFSQDRALWLKGIFATW